MASQTEASLIFVVPDESSLRSGFAEGLADAGRAGGSRVAVVGSQAGTDMDALVAAACGGGLAAAVLAVSDVTASRSDEIADLLEVAVAAGARRIVVALPSTDFAAAVAAGPAGVASAAPAALRSILGPALQRLAYPVPVPQDAASVGSRALRAVKGTGELSGLGVDVGHARFTLQVTSHTDAPAVIQEAAAAAASAAACGTGDPPATHAAVLVVHDVSRVPGVGPVIMGSITGADDAHVGIRDGTILAAYPGGATAVARSMSGSGSGGTGVIESARVGDSVGILCRGAALPQGFRSGSIVVLGATADAAALPAGFAETARFRVVLVRTCREAVDMRVGARITLALGASAVHCQVVSSRCLDAGSTERLWVAELVASEPCVVTTHQQGGALGRAGVRMHGPNTDPAVAVAFVSAISVVPSSRS